MQQKDENHIFLAKDEKWPIMSNDVKIGYWKYPQPWSKIRLKKIVGQVIVFTKIDHGTVTKELAKSTILTNYLSNEILMLNIQKEYTLIKHNF